MLTISTNTFEVHKIDQEQEAAENYKETTEQEFSPYHLKSYTLVDKLDETYTDIPYLCKIIQAKSVQTNFCKAVTSVGKSKSTTTYDTYRV